LSGNGNDVFSYPGEQLDVTWDRRLCIHIQECTRARNDVFISGRKPWGDPDAASPDEVVELVLRCPTGALALQRTDGSVETPPDENTITVSNNGPLYVRGELRIEGAPADMPGVRTRAALCRCGQSARKPFCDNRHEESEFRDHGAVGETSDPLGASGGPLAITPEPNGPYFVRGNVTLVTGSGRRAWQGEQAWLCRCGGSANKPFCDGSHTAVGFSAP
jgi:CDGSH-type Zn-finger protein/uncharacterized Fe-S cluster protein YjdI